MWMRRELRGWRRARLRVRMAILRRTWRGLRRVLLRKQGHAATRLLRSWARRWERLCGRVVGERTMRGERRLLR